MTTFNQTTMATLMANPSHRALWGKVMEGFKLISGSNWKRQANYEHFWPLCRQLFDMAGASPLLLTHCTPSLAFMLGAHAGRTRKGLRKRPYFHHLLMVTYVALLLQSSETEVYAAIHHDDVEDLPEHLGIFPSELENTLGALIPQASMVICLGLTNDPNAPDKHAAQVAKMASLSWEIATLKLLDRVANLYDMRQDKPKGFTPERIAEECQKAIELANAMPKAAPESVLALLAFAIDCLQQENNLV